jgi:exopolyphosphatase / guanosine-5'-triphosphate,3'-diphosphate pyrophosphatase
MSPQRSAFVDIGTNTILCLIAELDDAGRFAVLDDLAEIVRLGEGVDQSGLISAEGERRSVEVLKNYLRRCAELTVKEVIAVGTSALRDAKNSSAVRARFRNDLGLEVRVISGNEEAAYSFLAVQKGLALPGKELLVIDTGGGSTEFIRGNESGVSQALSLNVGSVRLTERFLHSDPVRAGECVAMVAAIDEELKSLRNQRLGQLSDLTLVGIAGTFTTLAAVEKKLIHYSHSEVHGTTLPLSEVRRQVRLFQEKSVAERKTIPGLEPKRADVILAGAYLIERIMTLFGAEQVIVSDQGVRYGLLYERLKNSVDIFN